MAHTYFCCEICRTPQITLYLCDIFRVWKSYHRCILCQLLAHMLCFDKHTMFLNFFFLIQFQLVFFYHSSLAWGWFLQQHTWQKQFLRCILYYKPVIFNFHGSLHPSKFQTWAYWATGYQCETFGNQNWFCFTCHIKNSCSY